MSQEPIYTEEGCELFADGTANFFLDETLTLCPKEKASFVRMADFKANAEPPKTYSFSASSESKAWDPVLHPRVPAGQGDESGEFTSGVGPQMTGKELHAAHASKLASIAQKIYDKWDESDEDTYAGGGICHLIAEAISSDLGDHDIESRTVSSNFEVHVYTVAKLRDGVYEVDIPHTLYERGGGYSWTKIPDVQFTAADVVIARLDPNPDRFNDYIDQE